MRRGKNYNSINDLKKWLINILPNKSDYKEREMKRVFQWRRYLEWNDLTTQEKLTAKRIILIPIIALPLLAIIRAYTPLIVIGLMVWLFYRYFEKGKLMK